MKIFEGEQAVVPEYLPSRAVLVSENLFTFFGREDLARAILDSGVDGLWVAVSNKFKGDLGNPEFKTLRDVLGDRINKVRLLRQERSGGVSLWARDWGPLSSFDREGGLRLIDFNYWGSKADDSAGHSLSQVMQVPWVSVPVANENGNFMNNSQGHCLMTERVLEANEDMTAQEIEHNYQKYAGCKQVTIMPRLPYEGTGHIDMWAKFVDDHTILVNELRDELLGFYSADDRNKVLEIQVFLNERARDLAGMGYRIIRLPMPAPMFVQGMEVFRSYTNSLIVNKAAIVPNYKKPSDYVSKGKDVYPDELYLQGYEREVRKTYESLGFRYQPIDSDKLIAMAGAVHCATMQVAR